MSFVELLGAAILESLADIVGWQVQQPFSVPCGYGSEVPVPRFGRVVQCRTMRREGKSVGGPGECLWFPDNRVCVAPPLLFFF